MTIEIYEDPSCPDCAGFENQAAAQLKTWMDTSTAKVRFYVVSYLNDASTTKYSSRAAAATYCAADAGRFPEYHAYLFANQPPPGNEGLTDAQLTSDGHEAGIDGAGVRHVRAVHQDREVRRLRLADHRPGEPGRDPGGADDPGRR